MKVNDLQSATSLVSGNKVVVLEVLLFIFLIWLTINIKNKIKKYWNKRNEQSWLYFKRDYSKLNEQEKFCVESILVHQEVANRMKQKCRIIYDCPEAEDFPSSEDVKKFEKRRP
jgi:hypothetical protein